MTLDMTPQELLDLGYTRESETLQNQGKPKVYRFTVVNDELFDNPEEIDDV